MGLGAPTMPMAAVHTRVGVIFLFLRDLCVHLSVRSKLGALATCRVAAEVEIRLRSSRSG